MLNNQPQMYFKTASKRAIRKIEEATGDLIGNKIANKIINESPQNPFEQLKVKQKCQKNKGKKLLMN